jgi:hypothetical protein
VIRTKGGHVQTKASPIAEEIADIKRNTDMTSERMFFGAFVNAYSSPVIEAKISLMAISMYLGANNMGEAENPASGK